MQIVTDMYLSNIAVEVCKLRDSEDEGQRFAFFHAGIGHQEDLVDINFPTDRTFNVDDQSSNNFCAVVKGSAFQFRGCVFSFFLNRILCYCQ